MPVESGVAIDEVWSSPAAGEFVGAGWLEVEGTMLSRAELETLNSVALLAMED